MHRLLIALFFVVCVSGMFAQNQPGPKVTSYSPFSQKEEEDSPDQNMEFKQNIKFNYSVLTRGAFVMGYERALSERFSLEGDIGLTYRDLFFELRNNLSENTTLIDEDSHALGGFYFSTRAKLFLNGKFPEGFYISPMLRYRTYNFKSSVYDSNMGDDILLKYNYHMAEAGFLFGYQVEGWFWDVLWDYSFGFGYQKGTYDTYPEYYSQDYTKVTEKTAYPMVYLSIKMGVPF